MILCLAYVVNDGLKAFLVVDIECACTLSPPFLANRRGRGIMCGEWTETFLLQRLEPAGAPGFELLPDLLGFAVARHDDVHMVRAPIEAWFKTPAIRVTVLPLSTGVGSCSGFCQPRSGGIS